MFLWEHSHYFDKIVYTPSPDFEQNKNIYTTSGFSSVFFLFKPENVVNGTCIELYWTILLHCKYFQQIGVSELNQSYSNDQASGIRGASPPPPPLFLAAT